MRRAAVMLVLLGAFGGGGVWPIPGEKAAKAARLYLDMLNYEQAIIQFDKAIADDPAEEGNRAGKGYAFYRLGRLDDAALALRSELVRNKENWQALTLLPLVQYVAGALRRGCRGRNRVPHPQGAGTPEADEDGQAAGVRLRYPNAGVPAFILGLCAARKGALARSRDRILQGDRLSVSGRGVPAPDDRRLMSAGTLGRSGAGGLSRRHANAGDSRDLRPARDHRRPDRRFRSRRRTFFETRPGAPAVRRLGRRELCRP